MLDFVCLLLLFFKFTLHFSSIMQMIKYGFIYFV